MSETPSKGEVTIAAYPGVHAVALGTHGSPLGQPGAQSFSVAQASPQGQGQAQAPYGLGAFGAMHPSPGAGVSPHAHHLQPLERHGGPPEMQYAELEGLPGDLMQPPAIFGARLSWVILLCALPYICFAFTMAGRASGTSGSNGDESEDGGLAWAGAIPAGLGMMVLPFALMGTRLKTRFSELWTSLMLWIGLGTVILMAGAFVAAMSGAHLMEDVTCTDLQAAQTLVYPSWNDAEMCTVAVTAPTPAPTDEGNGATPAPHAEVTRVRCLPDPDTGDDTCNCNDFGECDTEANGEVEFSACFGLCSAPCNCFSKVDHLPCGVEAAGCEATRYYRDFECDDPDFCEATFKCWGFVASGYDTCGDFGDDLQNGLAALSVLSAFMLCLVTALFVMVVVIRCRYRRLTQRPGCTHDCSRCDPIFGNGCTAGVVHDPHHGHGKACCC